MPPAAPAKHAPKIGMVSLGCPKALVDSERILTRLRGEGYDTSADYAGSDAVIVNTCAFIDSAREESLEAIAEARASGRPVIVTGCMGAEADMLRARFPDLAAVTGAHCLRRRARGRAPFRSPARPLRRDRAGPRRRPEADTAPLRLPEDQRGVRPPLQLLHHPVPARRPGLASRGRSAARGRGAGGVRRQGAAGGVPGHLRLRPGPALRRGRVARAGPGRPAWRGSRGAWANSACGCGCITSTPTRTSTR